jgi:hypothetical protein
VAQRIVDEREAIDLDENDAKALSPPGVQVAQSPVELAHEVAAVRQSGRRVMVARVLEIPLQSVVLLDLGRESRIDRA